MISKEEFESLQAESDEEFRRAPGTFVAFFLCAAASAAIILGVLKYLGYL